MDDGTGLGVQPIVKTALQRSVVAIAGRRIDAPGENEPRFPERDAATVREGVKRLLKAQKVGTVVASAACGADIVALEAALELGLELRVVLPFEPARFRESSVTDRGEPWGSRFDALREQAEASGHLIVVDPGAAADDAAYARATERILEEATTLAKQRGLAALALAIWDDRPRSQGDATKDFMSQAEKAGLQLLELSTLPVELAHAYIDGGEQEPEALLAFWPDLARTEPALASGLARALATRFLHGKKPMRNEAVDRIWRACKDIDAFGFARRILGRRLERRNQAASAHHPYPNEPSDTKLRQQQALCTSKDPDLSAAMRHDWALRILRPEQTPTDPETQGIAGGIWKRRWEWDGARSSLEKSLEHYRQGKPKHAQQDQGYCAINCAFVMDLLASLMGDQTTATQYRTEAEALRKQLVFELNAGDNLWADATLTEALVGLGEVEAAVAAMKSYLKHGPAPWEVETTLRQLVRLAHLRGLPDVRQVLEIPLGPNTDSTREAALTSLLVGRVGLALSGGGFRASLYHLGVLARLAESDVLRHVEALSCVSGGSIVGAHYYLCLRQALETKGDNLTRADYVGIVKRVIEEFVKGVSHNVRTRVLATFAHALAITGGNNRAYAEAVSKTIHETFYASLLDSDSKPLHELLIQPRDATHDFHPGRHNWLRRNKAPVLVLNAATLNTGHSWQFTARSMGESPFSILPEVDSNARLRRPNYRHGIPDRTIPLRDAVAASACVPGLFAPLQLQKLYQGHDVRLVDGGVFDNQGAASLIEQDCQVVLISDAAGQLFSETSAEGGHVAPLLRSVAIFQERIRQTGYDALFKRKEAGQLRGLAYTHLTQGLRAEAVDWDKCEDPQQANDQLPADSQNGSGNGAGVDREIQAYIAKMRTDLDVFSEIECAALMSSGYKSMDAQLDKLFADVPALAAKRRVETDWFFARVLPVVGGQDHDPKAFGILREHLKASSSKVGRFIQLNRRFRLICIVLAVPLLLVLAALAWIYRLTPLLDVGMAAVFVIPLLLGLFFGERIKTLTVLLLDPRRVLRVPLQHWAGAVLLTLFAKAALRWVDPKYLENGKLTKLFET